jgi:hypothetical protein
MNYINTPVEEDSLMNHFVRMQLQRRKGFFDESFCENATAAESIVDNSSISHESRIRD